MAYTATCSAFVGAWHGFGCTLSTVLPAWGLPPLTPHLLRPRQDIGHHRMLLVPLYSALTAHNGPNYVL